MKKVYVLYNPKAGKGKGQANTKKLDTVMADCDLTYCDITKIESYSDLVKKLAPYDAIVVSGGDGTLSRFVTDISALDIKNPVYYYATGSGNDFLKDTEKDKAEPFSLNEYIENLPLITVNEKDYAFINGVGGGLDAYSCEMGNKLHAKGKQANYVLNAVKGILYDYNPKNACVYVDGKEYKFKNVWFASVMKGRYFGGGIMLAPNQNRKGDKLTAVVVHSVGRLRFLPIVPTAFKGEHVKFTKYVTQLEGECIQVKFDRPVPLQIDGETVPGVTEYAARTKLAVMQ